MEAGPGVILPNPKAAIRLANRTCPYCGRSLADLESSTDHVVGRRFVPKGSLHGWWNLQVQSCTDCNSEKGQLEDELSAISMQPDAYGHLASEEALLKSEAERKGAGALSRTTGLPIDESRVEADFSFEVLRGVTMSVNTDGPPAIPEDRAAKLASMQMTAFFYLTTFDKSTRRGGFWPGAGIIADIVRLPDWGNRLQRSFAKLVSGWDPRFQGVTAGGFFKASMLKSPDRACWAWALEWNRNVRLVGFFGNEDAMTTPLARLQDLEWKVVPRPRGYLRFREEVPLAPDDDVLFGFWKDAS